MTVRSVARTALALLAGLSGGALFAWIGVPLPWMLGSLTAAAMIAIAGLGWSLPNLFRDFARPVIGVFAGSAFTLPIVLGILGSWQILPLLTAFIVAITVLGQVYFTRICGLDRTTAFFASTPGGLSELSLLGGLYGGDLRALVVIHSIRVVTVAFLVPFTVQLLTPGSGPVGAIPAAAAVDGLPVADWLLLAGCAGFGYWLGKVLKFTSGVMLVPMFLSALVHIGGLTELAPPGWLVAFVQVVIGSICGARFAGIRWKEFRSTILQGVIWAAFMLFAAFAMAFLSKPLFDQPVAALVLAFSPGGFAEVVVVAYAVGIEVAFVVSCQVFRIFLVLTLGPAAFGLLNRKQPGPPPT